VDEVTVLGDRDRLAVPLGALLENAVAHAAEDDRIEITARRTARSTTRARQAVQQALRREDAPHTGIDHTVMDNLGHWRSLSLVQPGAATGAAGPAQPRLPPRSRNFSR
jgi:hypothetical protein